MTLSTPSSYGFKDIKDFSFFIKHPTLYSEREQCIEKEPFNLKKLISSITKFIYNIVLALAYIFGHIHYFISRTYTFITFQKIEETKLQWAIVKSNYLFAEALIKARDDSSEVTPHYIKTLICYIPSSFISNLFNSKKNLLKAIFNAFFLPNIDDSEKTKILNLCIREKSRHLIKYFLDNGFRANIQSFDRFLRNNWYSNFPSDLFERILKQISSLKKKEKDKLISDILNYSSFLSNFENIEHLLKTEGFKLNFGILKIFFKKVYSLKDSISKKIIFNKKYMPQLSETQQMELVDIIIKNSSITRTRKAKLLRLFIKSGIDIHAGAIKKMIENNFDEINAIKTIILNLQKTDIISIINTLNSVDDRNNLLTYLIANDMKFSFDDLMLLITKPSNNRNLTEKILPKNPSFDDQQMKKLLHAIINNNCVNLFDFILENYNIHIKKNLLLRALKSSHDNPEIIIQILLILEIKQNIHLSDNEKSNLLKLAIKNDKIKVVNHLISENYPISPIHLKLAVAKRRPTIEIVEILFDKLKKETSFTDKEKTDILKIAIKNNAKDFKKIIKYLIEEVKCKATILIFTLMFCKNDPSVIRLIFQYMSPNLNAKETYGLLTLTKDPKILDLILEKSSITTGQKTEILKDSINLEITFLSSGLYYQPYLSRYLLEKNFPIDFEIMMIVLKNIQRFPEFFYLIFNHKNPPSLKNEELIQLLNCPKSSFSFYQLLKTKIFSNLKSYDNLLEIALEERLLYVATDLLRVIKKDNKVKVKESRILWLLKNLIKQKSSWFVELIFSKNLINSKNIHTIFKSSQDIFEIYRYLHNSHIICSKEILSILKEKYEKIHPKYKYETIYPYSDSFIVPPPPKNIKLKDLTSLIDDKLVFFPNGSTSTCNTILNELIYNIKNESPIIGFPDKTKKPLAFKKAYKDLTLYLLHIIDILKKIKDKETVKSNIFELVKQSVNCGTAWLQGARALYLTHTKGQKKALSTKEVILEHLRNLRLKLFEKVYKLWLKEQEPRVFDTDDAHHQNSIQNILVELKVESPIGVTKNDHFKNSISPESQKNIIKKVKHQYSPIKMIEYLLKQMKEDRNLKEEIHDYILNNIPKNFDPKKVNLPKGYEKKPLKEQYLASLYWDSSKQGWTSLVIDEKKILEILATFQCIKKLKI